MLAKVIARKAPARGFGEAVRYIARDRPDQAAEPRPEMGTLGFVCPLDTAEERQTAIAILDATAAAARRKTGSSPVYHVTLAWQAGEHPTAKQIDAACAQVLGALGFEGHEALWALHRDTEHDHVHLIVNRVHPDGHTAKVPRLDWLLLDQAMREIERAQGWRPSPGPYVVLETSAGPQVVRMSRAERQERGLLKEGPQTSPGAADAAHREAGASFQAWAAGGPAQAIKTALDAPGVTWERLHQQAARYRLRIEPKGSGMVVTTRFDDGRTLAAKASQLGRWASKAELEKRLGPWQPPPDKLPAASVSYQKSLDAGRAWADAEAPVRGLIVDERTARRMERSAARKALAARFKAEQDTARQDRPRQRADLVQQHRAKRAALTVQLREERKALTAQARQAGQLLAVAQSLWALRAAQQREALQKRQAAQRKALSAKLPKQDVWHKWLEREAAQGDEAAQAALRGIRYREQRKKNQQIEGIEGEELDPLRKLTLAGLEAQIDHRRQTVLYRGTDGRERFTDTGPRIVMHDKGDDSLEAALRLAAQKYGGKVDITGSSAFRERAARQAVRLGIEVMDADLQAVVQDERQRRQQTRQAAPAVSRAGAGDFSALKPEQKQARPHIMDVLRGTTARQIEAEAEARAKRVAEIIARAEAAESKAETGPPEMRAVDAALTAWQQAKTDAARSRAAQDWMRSMERIEQQGGDVAAANAHSRRALGGNYAGFMQEVGGLARQRVQNRENDRGMGH